MTRSETPTDVAEDDAPAAPTTHAGTPHKRPPVAPLARWLGPIVASVLFLPGAIYVLAVNRWHPTPPVVLLLLCWAAVVALGFNLTRMATSVTEDGDLEVVIEGSREDLEREKRKLVRAIKEVEFDRDCGKMSDGDANALIAAYRTRAIVVLKQLDALSAERPDSPRARVEADLRARLELDRAAAPGKGKRKGKPSPAETGGAA